jgi:hypothetical protein
MNKHLRLFIGYLALFIVPLIGVVTMALAPAESWVDYMFGVLMFFSLSLGWVLLLSAFRFWKWALSVPAQETRPLIPCRCPHVYQGPDGLFHAAGERVEGRKRVLLCSPWSGDHPAERALNGLGRFIGTIPPDALCTRKPCGDLLAIHPACPRHGRHGNEPV